MSSWEKPSDFLWSRAAALGSLWAAVEIVLGSFLHNLRVPLRGQAMTWLAIMLVSASYRRIGSPGLLWRAGLVCAVLKSLSPSAFLLGPMLAIGVEGFAMELGVRLAGARAGLVLGGALAMLWTFLHMLGKTALLFGFDAARLYETAWGKAQALSGLTWGPWAMLGLIAGAHLLAGAAASLIGQRPLPAAGLRAARAGVPGPSAPRGPRFGASTAGLALNIAALIGLLWAIRAWSAPASGALVAAAAGAWMYLYPGALRRLYRPSLWLSLAAVGVAGAWAFGKSEAGARLVFRALAITAGFSAISRELAGESVRRRIRWLGFEPWRRGVEEAFEALPRCVAALPEPREFFFRPGQAFASTLDAFYAESGLRTADVGLASWDFTQRRPRK